MAMQIFSFVVEDVLAPKKLFYTWLKAAAIRPIGGYSVNKYKLAKRGVKIFQVNHLASNSCDSLLIWVRTLPSMV
ncbi:MAG: hypothetical protein ACRCTY_05875, partial [Candidatus Adiutrix sp.]